MTGTLSNDASDLDVDCKIKLNVSYKGKSQNINEEQKRGKDETGNELTHINLQHPPREGPRHPR